MDNSYSVLNLLRQLALVRCVLPPSPAGPAESKHGNILDLPVQDASCRCVRQQIRRVIHYGGILHRLRRWGNTEKSDAGEGYFNGATALMPWNPAQLDRDATGINEHLRFQSSPFPKEGRYVAVSSQATTSLFPFTTS